MFIQGDSAFVLKSFRDNVIDLIVTSPPYDQLRTYGNLFEGHRGKHNFDFDTIAKELFRVTKDGGILVWVVNDSTIEGDETGTSFRQALYFKEIGFKLHDTMIYSKKGFAKPSSNRYHQTFEYMFVFCKGKLKTFNPIKDRKNSQAGTIDKRNNFRQENGTLKKRAYSNGTHVYASHGNRFNVWLYDPAFNKEGFDVLSCSHPASFPLTLAQDHIKSWSNEGDLILDPMCGSGTTCKAAEGLNRKWIGIEINPEYLEICKKRVRPLQQTIRLTNFIVKT